MPRNEFWLCFILNLEVCLSFSFCTEFFTYYKWVAPKRKSKWAGGLLRFMCIQTHPVWILDEPHLIIKIIRVKFRRKKWFFFQQHTLIVHNIDILYLESDSLPFFMRKKKNDWCEIRILKNVFILSWSPDHFLKIMAADNRDWISFH